MRLQSQFSALAAVGFGLILGAASTRADVFSWNNVTYSANNALTQTSLGNGGGTNTLSIKFTLNNQATFLTNVSSPTVDSYNTNGTYYTSGGNNAANRYLQIGTDLVNTSNTIGSVTVDIFFAKPVTSLSFSFFDVDINATGGNGYADLVNNIYGTTAGGTKVYLAQNDLTHGTANALTGTVGTTTFGVLANANNVNNLAGGNAAVAFSSATPITQLSYTYGDGYVGGGTHGTAQITGLGDLAFTSVPEPGTLAMLGLGVFGAAGVAFRRRQK